MWMDIRVRFREPWFCVREEDLSHRGAIYSTTSKLENLDNLMKVDMGLAADVGTLQRLPKVGQSQNHFKGNHENLSGGIGWVGQ